MPVESNLIGPDKLHRGTSTLMDRINAKQATMDLIKRQKDRAMLSMFDNPMTRGVDPSNNPEFIQQVNQQLGSRGYMQHGGRGDQGLFSHLRTDPQQTGFNVPTGIQFKLSTKNIPTLSGKTRYIDPEGNIIGERPYMQFGGMSPGDVGLASIFLRARNLLKSEDKDKRDKAKKQMKALKLMGRSEPGTGEGIETSDL